MELYREVNVSFKAIAKEVYRRSYYLNEYKVNSNTQQILFIRLVTNFTDKIAELEAENSGLIYKVNKLKDAVTAELTLKQGAKEAVS
jgi:hypothetical protein